MTNRNPQGPFIMTRPPRVLIIVALLVVVNSCKRPDEPAYNRPDEPVDLSKAIVGTWKSLDGKFTFTFDSDGTMVGQSGEESDRGNYVFVEQDKIRMAPDGREGGVASVKIDKDSLTLIEQQRPEETMVFKRVK
jgi:hypothetical protein